MHPSTVIIGIDPGLTGAIAYLGASWCAVRDLPTRLDATGEKCIDVRALAAQLQETVPQGSNILACMERLLPGGARESASNTWSVGVQHRTHALIDATLTLLGIDVELVTPQQWKKLYGFTGKGVNKIGVTKQAVDLAQRLYPDLLPDIRLQKHHNRAEAVLVGHWFKKVRA